MSFTKKLKEKNPNLLYSWQEPCIELIDEITQPYWFYPKSTGLYIYGPPGRGKTFLIDLLSTYERVDTIRLHFFSLCQKLQDLLNAYNDQNFDGFFKTLKAKTILLIDEVIIEDIADAMLFSRWFKLVQEKNLRIIMTSNIAVDNLYLGGLKRDAFLPTIDLMKKYCKSYKLESEKDLRKGRVETSTIFFNISQKEHLLSLFQCEHAKHSIELGTQRYLDVISAYDKNLIVLATSLFTHEAGKFDYKYLTVQFNQIALCDMHLFLFHDARWCKRFVTFIDFVFDHQTRLIFHGISSYSNLQSFLKDYHWPDRTLSRISQICSQSWACPP